MNTQTDENAPDNSYSIASAERRIAILKDNVDALDVVHRHEGRNNVFKVLCAIYDATDEALDDFKLFLIEHEKITTKALIAWNQGNTIDILRGDKKWNKIGTFINILKNNNIPIPKRKQVWDALTIPDEFVIDDFIKEHMTEIAAFMKGKTDKQIRKSFINYLTHNGYDFDINTHTKQKLVAYRYVN